MIKRNKVISFMLVMVLTVTLIPTLSFGNDDVSADSEIVTDDAIKSNPDYIVTDDGISHDKGAQVTNELNPEATDLYAKKEKREGKIAGDTSIQDVDVDTFDKLKTAVSDAASNGSATTINVSADIEFTEAIVIESPVNIVGTGANAPKLTVNAGGFRHFIISGSGLNVTMSGMTIEGTGTASVLTVDDAENGGIYSASSSVTLSLDDMILKDNVNLITANTDEGNSGAVNLYGTNANVNINDCDLFDNEANRHGGGVYASGNATITNSTFSGNYVDNVGGGVNAGNDITITNSTFSNNGGYIGGGVYARNDITITNSIFSDNETDIDGGGVCARNDITITNSTFSGNVADNNGGGVYATTAIITNSTFSGNEAIYGGGVSASTATITNSTFSNNKATSKNNLGGGGVYVLDKIVITSSTFSGNNAIKYGGGVFIHNEANIKGSIITNNTAGAGNNVYISHNGNNPEDWQPTEPSITNKYNIIGTTAAMSLTDIFGTETPKLKDNGGDTQTISIPKASSAAGIIPSTSYSTWTAGTDAHMVDQRGISRPSGADAKVAVGAYEPTEPSDDNLKVTNTNNKGTGSLRSAIGYANSITAQIPTITFDPQVFDESKTINITSQLPDITNPMIIQGPAEDNAIIKTAGGGFRHLRIVGDGLNVTMSGMTIEGTGTPSAIDNAENGGIYSSSSNVTLSLDDMTLKDNVNLIPGTTDESNGGALNLYGTNANVTINDCDIFDNKANRLGGGVYASGNATITNSTFSGNKSGYGGGVNAGNDITITNSTFSDNVVDFRGGGVYAENDITITNSTFSDNVAYDRGGGVSARNDITVTDSTFSDNVAGMNRGGGVDAGTATITNSTFSGNKAPVGGGALADAATITNSTFSKNKATAPNHMGGGGVCLIDKAFITNCTFSGNYAGKYGGGVYVDHDDADIKGSIITNNTAGAGNNVYISHNGNNPKDWQPTEPAVTNKYNIIGTTAAMSLTDIFGTETPKLKDNGGATETIMPSYGSIALDQIPVASYAAWTANTSVAGIDQRGYAKPDASNPNFVDIGSVEVAQPTPPAVEKYTVTLDVNGGDVLSNNKLTVEKGKPYGTLPVAKRTGYIFSGWYTEKTGGIEITAATTVNLTKDQTLYARWSANKYKITFVANKGKIKKDGKYKLRKLTKKKTYNAKFGALPKVKRAGYNFKGWYTTKKKGGKKITKNTVMTYAKDKKLYARWSKNGKIVNCKTAYLRKGPGASKRIIGAVKNGQKICIIKKINATKKHTWYKVKVGKKTGYIYSKYVKRV